MSEFNVDTVLGRTGDAKKAAPPVPVATSWKKDHTEAGLPRQTDNPFLIMTDKVDDVCAQLNTLINKIEVLVRAKPIHELYDIIEHRYDTGCTASIVIEQRNPAITQTIHILQQNLKDHICDVAKDEIKKRVEGAQKKPVFPDILGIMLCTNFADANALASKWGTPEDVTALKIMYSYITVCTSLGEVPWPTEAQVGIDMIDLMPSIEPRMVSLYPSIKDAMENKNRKKRYEPHEAEFDKLLRSRFDPLGKYNDMPQEDFYQMIRKSA